MGPFIGGFLTQNFGWRSIFFTIAPVTVLLYYITWKHLAGEWREAQGEPFDFMGSVLYGLAIFSLMFGFTRVPSPFGFALIPGGIVFLLAFGYWEWKQASPALDIHLFLTNKVFAFSNLAALINYSSTFAVSFILSLYLQYMKGFTPQEAGLVLITQPVMMAFFSPISGRLSDRVEPRRIASLGMGLTGAGLFLLAFIAGGTSTPYIVSALLVLGVGFGLFASPNINAVMSAVERRFYGVASGTLGTMRLTGQMFSMAITMMAFSIYAGSARMTSEHHPHFLESMHFVFVLFAVLSIFGIFASLARGNVRTEGEPS